MWQDQSKVLTRCSVVYFTTNKIKPPPFPPPLPPPPGEACELICMYATEMASAIPTFVHPSSEAFSALSTSAALTYDGSETFNSVPVTETNVGSDKVDYSTLAESNDVRVFKMKKVDSTITLGTMNGTTMIASYQSGGLKYEEGYVTDAHMYGFSKCHSFGRCEPSNVVGSSCHGGKGYCYESSTGTIECGRTVATMRRFSSTEVDTYSPMLRCPRGTPAEKGAPTNILITAKRLLIAGCMIANDANFHASAEVHVPQMCAIPADYQKGCLFPGAENFSPGSSQVGFCQYKTNGCTSPTALNYNSKATENDGSCIEPKKGCTVKTDGYFGVDPNTPKYESRYVGMPLRQVGVYDYPAYPSVKNYDATANVLSGCIAAVEGCMDSTAHNYNPAATMNTNTWCIPKIEGCMLPLDDRVTNFNPLATVHVKSTCKLYHQGCTSEAAYNYERYATVQSGTCYAFQPGCLRTTAINFGCPGTGYTEPCADLSTNNVLTAKSGYVLVTAPAESACIDVAANAVTQDYLAANPNEEYNVSTVVVLEGSVSYYLSNPQLQVALETDYCTYSVGNAFGGDVAVCMQETVVKFEEQSDTTTRRRRLQTTGKTKVTYVSKVPGSAAVAAVNAGVAATIGQASYPFPAVQAALPGTVIGIDTPATAPDVARANPAKKKKSDNTAVIAGAAVGGVVGGLLIVGIIYYMMQKQKGSYAKTVVPA